MEGRKGKRKGVKGEGDQRKGSWEERRGDPDEGKDRRRKRRRGKEGKLEEIKWKKKEGEGAFFQVTFHFMYIVFV